ncbi:hypothetical protein FHX42_002723 [Saccharopolyspora lacisalsi]|uniref:Uncharacterized protein n=1 Tax=Halosaccharopolyspora lacisalsi TaxID=1000566 RepID=A0A839DTR8_9PSEU|nr:hypothetical protein [Halosaccharopolyspora lacisalsi]MBA8825372.1 hypothetical protein [Halosaccharopolyspora lacisalsi]
MALVFVTLGLTIVALWKLTSGGWLWWKWWVPDSRARRGIARFFDALRKNTKQPAHKWPLWAPFIMAVVMSYAAYFDHGVFLAKAHEGTPSPEGRLVVESCEPNWTVLGLRSTCTGTVTPLLTDDTEHYEASFSRFDSADVGRSIDVFRSYGILAGQSWTAAREDVPPPPAEFLIGGSLLVAFAFWYLFLARLVVLGVAFVARQFRKDPEGAAGADDFPRESGNRSEGNRKHSNIRIPVPRRHCWRYWAIAVVLAYAAYFSYGLFLGGDQGGSKILSVNGHLVLESCEPNWAMLGMRSQCEGVVDPIQGYENNQLRYDRSFSVFETTDVGKRIPVYLSGSSEWQPKYEGSAPGWLGFIVFPLFLGTLIMFYRGLVIIIGGLGSPFSRS